MTVEKSTKRFFRHVSRIIKLCECKQQFKAYLSKAYLSKPRKYTKKMGDHSQQPSFMV